MPIYCKERCVRNLLERERGKRQRGRPCLLVPSYLTSLRKKNTKSRGNKGRRREGMQGYGTLWEKPFRKGMGATDRRMSCLLGPSHWTFLRKKRRQEGKEGVNRKGGKQCYALLLQGTLCYKPC